MNNIKVALDPQHRKEYIDMLLMYDGLSHIKEDASAAYCALSLTSTPQELKTIIQKRQDILMNEVLKQAGISAYDPGSAPYSPDKNLTAQPNEIYVVDSGKIVGARFFVSHNLLPSTGFGIELEKAKFFNRIPVVIMDKHIRMSRMQPHRTIYLEYDNFEKEYKNFIPVFELLKQYEPGMGFNNDVPALLGFGKDGSVIDLEELVYSTFPTLQYHFDGTIPIVNLRSENPELFYENVTVSV